MKKIAFIIFLFSSIAQAQETPDYKKIIKKLTDSSMVGRGYVDSGSAKAASYISDLYEKIGAQTYKDHSYYQRFNLNVNTFPKKVSVTLNGKELSAGYDYLYGPMSGSASGTYKIVELKLKDVDSKKEYRQLIERQSKKSKILYLNTDGIKQKKMKQNFRNLAYGLAKHAPVMLKTSGKLMWSVGRKQFEYPIIRFDPEVFKDAPKKIKLEVQPKLVENYPSQNVIGYVEGQEKPDEVIIVCGHYDHLGKMGQAIFPGGNDNASGTAGMIEIMKHYVKNPHKYSMLFIAFGGEEAGLVGSEYYARNPWVPIDKTRFVLDLDIMGSADEGITVVNGKVHEKHFDRLKSINEDKNYLPSVKPRSATQNSDHAPFHKKGIESFFIYTRGSAKKYHEVDDNFENLPLKNFMPLVNLMIDFTDQIE